MEEVVQIITTLLKQNEVLYISAPITTGKRYIDWYIETGHALSKDKIEEQKKIDVTAANIKDAQIFIEDIKKYTSKTIIEPISIEEIALQWEQNQFHIFWSKVIENLVDEVVFVNNWEYSIGCCTEFLMAFSKGCKMYSQHLIELNVNESLNNILIARETYQKLDLPEANLYNQLLVMINKITPIENSISFKRECILKDEKLDYLYSEMNANIAKFFSVDPQGKIRFDYLDNNKTSTSIENALSSIFAVAQTVNVRSYSLSNMKGNDFHYGLEKKNIKKILDIIKANEQANMFSIINETIDVNDGGVSGVVLDGVMEFAPEKTPKCVEDPGICRLPRTLGMKILSKVYGFVPLLNYAPDYRIEFSLHPNQQGIRDDHTIIWEYEYIANAREIVNEIVWPNNFSRFIGDKLFGLLIADSLGFLVPRTVAFLRNIAPFTFGVSTGSSERWMRTCPREKTPGLYFSGKVWEDPYLLMEREEKKGLKVLKGKYKIASILSQDAVDATYSGTASIENREMVNIEGVIGAGDSYMVGEINPQPLPDNVIQSVSLLCNKIGENEDLLGPVKIEWAFDGTNTWLLQLNQSKKKSTSCNYFVDGKPKRYKTFYVTEGLEALRQEVEHCKGKDIGIKLIGNIGMLSHFGDILRNANIPSYLQSKDD